MPAYKPARAEVNVTETVNKEIGWGLLAEFEPFQPDPNYSFKNRVPIAKDGWPITQIFNAPLIKEIPPMFQNLIDMTWKVAEPADAAPRFAFAMGARGQTGFQSAGTYHPQVAPTKPVIRVKQGDTSAIANDWKVFEDMKRVNAATFRGDTRPPFAVITGMKGFGPPNSRTDQYYLENNVYDAFEDYLKRRYQRTVTKPDFLRAVGSAARSDGDKKLLVDYMMWRQICQREAAHIGRMAANECLKGYISTARSIDTSISFGTKYNSQPGWLYVTLVHAGFIVPWGQKAVWGTEEAEIAQWGAIPAERIVGFVHIDRFRPDGPIFMRRSFRKKEPKAFDFIFKAMSGMNPD